MILFELLTKENMSEVSLDKFDRIQNVQRVYRKIDNEYVIIEDKSIMDWSLERKRAIASSLLSEDYIAYGVMENGNIIAFASMEIKVQDERIILDMMQVSRKYRRQQIGKKLFQYMKEVAKDMGAKQLYISACSSEETIKFYKSMGCEITDNPITKFAEEEPFDLQMVCAIKF